jgi:flagellar biosynthetic protein FlhB
MSEDTDESQKTEEPTEKRIQDARDKGQVAKSRELNNFFSILVLTFLIASAGSFFSKSASLKIEPFLNQMHRINDIEGIGKILYKGFEVICSITIVPMLILMLAMFLSGIIQTEGFLVSSEAIEPKMNRISLASGIKKLFSMRSIVELVKGVIKVSLVAVAIYFAIHQDLRSILFLFNLDNSGIEKIIIKITGNMLIASSVIMFFVAILDYLYQRHEYYKSLKMTKEEIKEEFKQSEGNPEIKGKLKRIRAERAKKRMMANVPKADVIITNPTHYAIALEYKENKMNAPKVLAKGMDSVALKIKEIAKENKIPTVENPKLARAMYDAVKIDEEIPVEFYKSVAEIISYIYNLKGK